MIISERKKKPLNLTEIVTFSINQEECEDLETVGVMCPNIFIHLVFVTHLTLN